MEGNSLAKNNGWAIHLDLRFGGHDTSSSILQLLGAAGFPSAVCWAYLGWCHTHMTDP